MKASLPPSSKVPLRMCFPAKAAILFPPSFPPVYFTALILSSATIFSTCSWLAKTLQNSLWSKPLRQKIIDKHNDLRFGKSILECKCALGNVDRMFHDDWVADHNSSEGRLKRHPKRKVVGHNHCTYVSKRTLNLPRVGPRGWRITTPLSPDDKLSSSVLRKSLDF